MILLLLRSKGQSELAESLLFSSPKTDRDYLMDLLSNYSISEYAIPKQYEKQIAKLIEQTTPEQLKL